MLLPGIKKAYQHKKLFILTIAMCICQCAFAQPENLYSAAFHYIRNLNKTREIIVNDTLQTFPLYSFNADLSGHWYKSLNITERAADSVDWESEPDQRVHLDFLKQLSVKGARPTQLVYFSKVSFGRLLIAETMPEKHGVSLNHYAQAVYNDCTQYLFIFDEEGKIEKVYAYRKVPYR